MKYQNEKIYHRNYMFHLSGMALLHELDSNATNTKQLCERADVVE